MGVRDVRLGDEEEAAMRRLVDTGRCGDAGQALRAGLVAVAEAEARREAFVSRINDAHDRARAGERADVTWDSVKERVLRRARGG